MLYTIYICILFEKFSHSNAYIVVPYGVHLYFSEDLWCWASFHMLLCHQCIFLGKVSVQIFCHLSVVCLVLSFKDSLHILDTSPLKVVWFENIFSCLWLFIVNSVFHEVIVFNFDTVWFINFFMAYSFEAVSKYSLPNPRSRRFLFHAFF